MDYFDFSVFTQCLAMTVSVSCSYIVIHHLHHSNQYTSMEYSLTLPQMLEMKSNPLLVLTSYQGQSFYNYSSCKIIFCPSQIYMLAYVLTIKQFCFKGRYHFLRGGGAVYPWSAVVNFFWPPPLSACKKNLAPPSAGVQKILPPPFALTKKFCPPPFGVKEPNLPLI